MTCTVRSRWAWLLIAVGTFGLGSWAQAQSPAVQSAQTSGLVTAAPVSALVAPAGGGIQGQNIFEVKQDANLDPNYAKQTNAERSKVQPGNNAPMWRQVGAGATGHSSLPLSQAPEAGNLIQSFVQIGRAHV